MSTPLDRLARGFSFVCLISVVLFGAPAGAAIARVRSAVDAAREVASQRELIFWVAGQPRTLILTPDEVALPLRSPDVAMLPAGAELAQRDSQHQFVHLPAGVTAAEWLENSVAVQAANGVVFHPLARSSAPELAPVFYERGREGDPAGRHVATTKLLLVGLDQTAASATAASTGATAMTSIITKDLWVLDYGSAYQMISAAGALQREGLSVEPQLTHELSKRAAPNDPLYNQQFYFKNTGQGGGTPGEDLNIEGLWPAASGAGVTVAVVDDGLELIHPDLAPNIASDATLHGNVLDENNDPAPPAASNHGTICAGFIAARGNNGIGMTGAAPQARLVAVRMLGTGKAGNAATDLQEAAALGWRTDVVQISSNSWGPSDDAKTVSAPDTGALAALRAATTTGRAGRGVVYFVAAGNGRDAGDYAGYDGYSGSRYVLAIGATDNRGKQAPFSESGPQVIACAAGQTSEDSDVQLLATDNVGPRGANTAASPEGDYTTSGVQGTSYSTPQAAGVAALMLQANANLSWRDVKEIFIRTARKNDATDSDWITNGGGFHFSHKYGAGYVDATGAVTLARTWTNLGAELSATQSSTASSAIPDNDPNGTSRALVFASATNLRVETIEVAVSVVHANRGQLRFEVTSPVGTRTVLGLPRTPDTGADLINWVFSSPRHWGETGNGTWTVRVIDTVAGVTGTLTSASVTLFGAAAGAPSAPAIATQPAAQTASLGGSTTLSVVATSSSPVTYQWRKDGINIAGATGATLTLNNLSATDAGNYTVIVTNVGGSTTSVPVALSVVARSDPGRLINLSLLTSIDTPTDSFTMGTVIGGSGTTGTKPVLVRAVGPSLIPLGVGGTLADPNLEFFSGTTKIGENDDWGGTAALSNAFAQVGAFAYVTVTSKDAAIYNPAIASGGYSIRVTGNRGTTGTVIAELYDSTPSSAFTAATPRLINVSVIKQIGSGFTVGFVIGGSTSRTVLIRAVGPGLAGVGVTGFVPNPRLALFAGSTRMDGNDDWGGTAALKAAMSQVGAFAIPADSLDAALLATLQPGQYSVQVAAPSGTNGLVIAEVYEVP